MKLRTALIGLLISAWLSVSISAVGTAQTSPDSPQTKATPIVAAEVVITVRDDGFDPSSITVEPGSPVTLVFQNLSENPRQVFSEGLAFVIDIPPGATRSVGFDSIDAGSYDLGSPAPNADQPGLQGSIVSGEAPSASPTPGSDLQLVITDAGFEPLELNVEPLTQTILQVTNEGDQEHAFTIDSLAIDVIVQPGESEQVSLFLFPGSYIYYSSKDENALTGFTGKINAATMLPNSLTPVSVGPTVTPSAEATVTGTETAACSGFADYQEAYSQALAAAASPISNLNAVVDKIPAGATTEQIAALMTPDDLRTLATLFGNFAVELAKVTPPAIAADWQAAQLVALQVDADLLNLAADQGYSAANTRYGAQVDAASADTAAALAAARDVCSDFATWAATQGV